MNNKIGVLRDKLYIPAECVSASLFKKVNKKFTHTIEQYVAPEMCTICYRKHEGEPPCADDPTDCVERFKTLLMYDKKSLCCGNFLALWRGNIPLLMKFLPDFKIRDSRCTPTANRKLAFTGKLRKYQVEASLKWVQSKYGGMIKAPARSGKTVIGTYLTCKLGYKTLILTHQIDLIDQFYDTFMKLTNAEDVKKSVVIAKKGNVADLVKDGYDIILSTYQTFITQAGKERLNYCQDKFGFVIVDECHLVGAKHFSNTATTLNPYLFLGLTATDVRKDGRDVLARYALGDVVSHVKPPSMTGTASFIYTGISVGDWKRWTTMIGRLAKNNRRNKIIFNYALQDLKEGHNVLLVMERRIQVDSLYDLFNDAKIPVKKLYGQITDRKEVLNELRKGKIKVTVATRKIVQYGLDVKPWSCYYCLTPTTNPPNFYQEMSRIRTPHKGKKEPFIRIFIDDIKTAKYKYERTCKGVLDEEKFTWNRLSVDGKILKNVNKRKKRSSTLNTWNKFVDFNN